MRPILRTVIVTVAAVALTPLAAPQAVADPLRGRPATAAQATVAPTLRVPALKLPEGWTVTPGGRGYRLAWKAPEAVPFGDARVEFYAGDRLLGVPRAASDRRTFSLDVAAAAVGDPSKLQVRAAGRRIDAAGLAEARSRRQASAAGAEAQAAAPALPAAKVDPGKPGAYRTLTGEYALKDVRLPDLDEPVEMRAVVVAPKGAKGRRPLALFLHGRHAYCYGGSEPEFEWPCPGGTKPIPSHRGYLKAQKLLASQGYVTVSISANGINAQDEFTEDGGAQARSSLVRLHLARWAEWSASRNGAPAIVRSSPVADLSKTLLVGHSRGGEGVNRAAMDSLTPPPAAADGYRGRVRWRVSGTLLIAPTIFGQNPAADVPSAVLLPGCDGDVFDLQGQQYLDATRGVSRGKALHGAMYVVGANHNYFNTEWTPGLAQAPAEDDWFDPEDPLCGTGKRSARLKPSQQQAVGATYIAAAARLFVGGDDRVRPLLDGTGVRAPSVAPARVLTHALGAHRTPLVLPAPNVAVTRSGASKARICSQVTPDDDRERCIADDEWPASPHFLPFDLLASEPGRHAVAMTWTAAGGAIRMKPAKPASMARATAVALRVAVPPGSKGTQFDVAVSDVRGRRAVLGRARLDGLPASDPLVAVWGQEVRVPTAAARKAKLDLGKVTRLELIPRSKRGQAWLVDAWGWRAGTPKVKPAALARIDVGKLDPVPEGDSGVRTYRMPVKVSGKGSGRVRFLISDGARVTERMVTVRPGTKRIDVPVQVRGDTLFEGGELIAVLAKAVRGTVVGDYVGPLPVIDDDPAPTVSVTPVTTNVTEGGTLRWRVSLSAAMGDDLYVALPIVAPQAGPELSTTDLPADWVREILWEEPLPSRPLSSLEAGPWAVVPSGSLSAEFTVPTVADGEAEPAEHLRMRVEQPEEGQPPLPDLTATVTDAP